MTANHSPIANPHSHFHIPTVGNRNTLFGTAIAYATATCPTVMFLCVVCRRHFGGSSGCGASGRGGRVETIGVGTGRCGEVEATARTVSDLRIGLPVGGSHSICNEIAQEACRWASQLRDLLAYASKAIHHKLTERMRAL